jgi:hypothetical protein
MQRWVADVEAGALSCRLSSIAAVSSPHAKLGFTRKPFSGIASPDGCLRGEAVLRP